MGEPRTGDVNSDPELNKLIGDAMYASAERLINKIQSQPKSRYLEGISSDLIVYPDECRSSLAFEYLSFCTSCGCVVYRRDIHDAWHDAVARALEAELLDRRLK